MSSIWTSKPIGEAATAEAASPPPSKGFRAEPIRVRTMPAPHQMRPDDRIQPIGFDEETGEPIYAEQPAEGGTLPSGCLRRLSLPAGRADECGWQNVCVGQQREGGCLADLVREANEAGQPWSVKVDDEGWWLFSIDQG